VRVPRASGNTLDREDGRGWGRAPMEGATGFSERVMVKPLPSLSTTASPPRRRYLKSPGSLAPVVAGPVQKRGGTGV